MNSYKEYKFTTIPIKISATIFHMDKKFVFSDVNTYYKAIYRNKTVWFGSKTNKPMRWNRETRADDHLQKLGK